MQSLTFVTLLAAFVSGALAASQPTQKATFDTIYDKASTPITAAACGNQLVSKYPTFGDVPSFPAIGGSSAVTNFASAECGSCWKLTAADGTIEYFTAIDTAGDGFNLSEETMSVLGGQAGIDNGSIQVTATEVDRSLCGQSA